VATVFVGGTDCRILAIVSPHRVATTCARLLCYSMPARWASRSHPQGYACADRLHYSLPVLGLLHIVCASATSCSCSTGDANAGDMHVCRLVTR
jgi:hypothetical protein